MANNAASNGNEPLLLLQINWTGNLVFGAQLSPQFTLVGGNLTSKPNVEFKLDDRIDGTYWKTEPEVFSAPISNDIPTKYGGVCSWEFHEHLTVQPIQPAVGDAVYTLTLNVHYEEPRDGILCPFSFRIVIRMNVKGDATHEVVIDAENDALINTHNIDWSQFSRVVIHGSKDSVINLSKGFIPPELETKPKENNSQNNLFHVQMVGCGVDSVQAAASQRTILLLARFGSHQKLFHLFGREDVLLGRAYKENAENKIRASDIAYRFYREGPNEDTPGRFLSNFISRNHALLRFLQEGVTLQDSSVFGVEVECGDKMELIPKRGKIQIAWDDVQKGVVLYISKFAKLRLSAVNKKHNGIDGQLNLNLENEPLWKLGTPLGIDALRVERIQEFAWGRFEELKALMEEKGQAKFHAKSLLWENDSGWKNDLLTDEEYFCVFRAIYLGDSLDDTIRIQDQELSTRHVTFYFANNHFGMMNNHPTRGIQYTKPGAEPQYLYRDQPLDLVPGMHFQVGKVKFDVFKDYEAFLQDVRKTS